MQKSQGKKVRKAVVKPTKKRVNKAKKLSKIAKNNAPKVKGRKKKSLVSNAKTKMNTVKNQSFKALKRAKNKVYATEQEIAHYVKENPIKSISTVALVGLIAGFISSLKKSSEE